MAKRLRKATDREIALVRRLLAGAPDGLTGAALGANGATPEAIFTLVEAGEAEATIETLTTGKTRVRVRACQSRKS